MKVFNKIIDIVYDIFEYIILLAILALAILVIIWRFDVMYKESIEFVHENTQLSTHADNTHANLDNEEVEVVIPIGTNPAGIVNILKEYGLVKDGKELLENLEGLDQDQLPSGNFKLSFGLSDKEIFNLLVS